ncbi:unnamed protein product, partial [Sphacelaria rigidula]
LQTSDGLSAVKRKATLTALSATGSRGDTTMALGVDPALVVRKGEKTAAGMSPGVDTRETAVSTPIASVKPMGLGATPKSTTTKMAGKAEGGMESTAPVDEPRGTMTQDSATAEGGDIGNAVMGSPGRSRGDRDSRSSSEDTLAPSPKDTGNRPQTSTFAAPV